MPIAILQALILKKVIIQIQSTLAVDLIAQTGIRLNCWLATEL